MEFRRILLGKTFLFILAALVCLNCFFFLYQQTDYDGDFRAFPETYHQVVTEFSACSWEEGLTKTQEYEEKVLEDMHEDDSWRVDMEDYHRLRAVEEVGAQYEYLLGYKDYIEKIQNDAKKLQSVSIFGDPDSFAYKNTVKTAEEFAPMADAEVTFGHDLAVTKVLEDEWADYSCLLLMIVVCALFLAERKEGLWPMVYAVSGGRRKLAAKRIVILLLAAWLAVLLLFGSRILLSGWLFHGFGEWDRVIQSIPLFYNVPREMTVGQFWAFYLLIKALGTFLIGLILWTVMSAIANLGLALCGAGLVLGVEFACTAILPSSMFAMLRYCNIFSYIRFFEVFSSYLNLSVFGVLVSGSDLVLWLLAPLCLLFAAAVLVIAEKKHPIAPANRILSIADRLMKKVDPHTCGGSLLGQEAKKLLLRRKGALMLLVLVLLMIRAESPMREYERWDMYCHYYQEKYAGPISEETIENLRAELEIAQETDRIIGLNLMIMDAEIAPEGSWLVPVAPYEAIWSDNLGNYHRSTALTVLLFLVLILSPLASQERQNGVEILLRSTPGGRRKLRRRKQILLLLVTVLVWALVYGTELIKTAQFWGSFQCLEAPAYSLKVFRDYEWSASLGLTMALYYGAKLLVLLAVGEICLLLSGFCGKNRDAVLLCCGVILVPSALAAIGSAMGESLSCLMPLAGVEQFGNVVPLLTVLLIGGAATLVTHKKS